MYPVHSQLLIKDFWSACVAVAQGFEIESFLVTSVLDDKVPRGYWVPGIDFSWTPNTRARLIVTDQGCNYFERLIPKRLDLLRDWDRVYVVDDVMAEAFGVNSQYISLAYARELFDEYDKEVHGRDAVRIVERESKPFPMFDELIMPDCNPYSRKGRNADAWVCGHSIGAIG